ncbi:TPA: hypothetical protein DDW69_01065 [candidate division CPR2 bacterium]|uniref:Response regulator receiver protein n=1 Tax=candidate division CPR2 bacterium GW2011_GWC1_41_48 TaxID=1618344 RepID=A0A0G0W9F0_UNCC2|nr:MAG: Response regulator receiver protein [candidate division CPR2 bacterium GW2011_GWC2_39_35]KKR28209.1 MAG: Response regulator receiver protein [candidate division CPR2 bacterium GW2011_GWD2_39_7]KKR28640.1 MAG: Response regulator receiver protein [candidate division CPR2 bacterium GW2011_GWD1_39_7]KKS09614.1 MAG: Response regulator receiver protein [candidate division CPR2 bacterium GW2011_GWC1_41_48]OGB61323.1 MAG: hypothetical protein A2Y27_02695 [candidate division CPR2 bacterium GWD1_
MKILVIEDDRLLSDVMNRILKFAGYEAIFAKDGAEGLKIAKDNDSIGLVFLDLLLPQKNGFEVLKELKGDDQTKDIPVVIVSNIAEEAKIKECKENGALDYIIKSNISVNALKDTIKRYLKTS